MRKVFNYIFCALVTVGALGKELVQKRYSCPAPDPGSGRTVAALGTDGGTVYVTPLTDHLFWILGILCATIFVVGIFWPADKPMTTVRPLNSVPGPATAKTLTYDREPRKRNRYGFPAVAFAIAAYIWIAERHMTGWWLPRIAILAVALWSLHMLIDYRTRIDTGMGMFEREKLLFGRYRIGSLRLPLSHFTAVVLDRYQDPDNGTVQLSVGLKDSKGRLTHVCNFEVPDGQRCEDAERVAGELAEATKLRYEEVVR